MQQVDNINVCHFTILHDRYDSRIFWKECGTLAKHYDTHLIVADGKGDEVGQNVKIKDIGKIKNRIKNLFLGNKKLLRCLLSINANIYHFHDPELMPVALKLKKRGYKVIYDIHEDLPLDIYYKPWIPNWLKPIVSKLVYYYEKRAAKKFDCLITSTDFIRDKFLKININTNAVRNFPDLNFFHINKDQLAPKTPSLCYIGLISKERRIDKLIEWLPDTNATLHLAGMTNKSSLLEELKNLSGWKQTIYHGFVNHEDISAIIQASDIGVLLPPPMLTSLDSLPIKIFEYMYCSIPIIVSNFPLWKTIVEDANCGVCIDPFDKIAFIQTVNELIKNKELRKKMGENGRNAILQKYNWQKEALILLDCYKKLLTH